MTRRSFVSTGAVAAAQTGAPPNFVFLISDDHSAAEPGLATPHLDRMAREGTRFTRCFVSSPQCSPNRSSILTGCTPHTTSTSRLHTPMPEWEPTFLEPLKERGYFTGAFGKVHQGKEFDRRWNATGATSTEFEKFFDAAPRGRPFFLHVGFRDPHRPYRAGMFSPPHAPASVRVPKFLPDTPEIREDLAHYHDAIARMDAEVGRVFESLRRRGLDGNTLVVFTGDNGMPFPGAKGTCYDPGIHVPLVAWWPGRIAAGWARDDLVAHVDLAPMWLEAAGAARPRKMQGTSLLPAFLGKARHARTAVFSERNWHDNFDPIRSVRTERHKLIFNAAPHFPYRPAWDLAASPSWRSYGDVARSGKLRPEHRRLLEPARPVVELYDLLTDPDEFHNRATDPQFAAVRDELVRRLSDWMHDTYDFLPPGLGRPGEPAGRGWPVSL
ncbi:MAG: sulfatase family protein [Bryobacteraceae bacterium]